jgi:TRAP-type mannitol/chloroaromatic compound transport system substrate-binding protein
MQAKYDALNPIALKRLIQGGAQLRAYPPAVMDACYKATQELINETNMKSASFKKIYTHMSTFQRDQQAWFRVAEASFDNFMYKQKL